MKCFSLLKKTLLKGGDGSSKKEDEVFVLETEGYINCVSALLKLIEVSINTQHCVPPVIPCQCFLGMRCESLTTHYKNWFILNSSMFLIMHTQNAS